MACHAGGQFPELTPYGRLFKLTGYTSGERGNPLAAMIIGDYTATKNNTEAGAAVNQMDRRAMVDFGSLFIAGKLTDKLGGFAQLTYNVHDTQDASGNWVGHFGSDNTDLRYSDRLLGANNTDLIWGVTLNNNAGVQDVWNSAPAWGYQYVGPTQAAGGPPVATALENGSLANTAGLGVYAYLNRNWYAELSGYQTAKGLASFLSIGSAQGNANHPLTVISGVSPYLRLAYTKEWGSQNAMVGFTALNTKLVPLDGTGTAIPGIGVTNYKDLAVDAQYQYLSDPHTLTAQARYVHESINDSSGTVYAGDSTLNSLMLKTSYVYQDKYGASFSFRNISGSADATAYSSSANLLPNTRIWTPEVFWMPVQNVRLGIQYNYFSKYLGASSNYDGNGRNAGDNNSLFLYVWAAM